MIHDDTTTQIIDNKEVLIYSLRANTENTKDENLGYQLDYIFCPEVKSESDIEQLFEGQKAYIESALNGKIEFEKIIELNGAIGRHIYFTVDNSTLKSNYKMYFKNGIFYYLSVITDEGHLFNKAINRFFGSFKID